MKLPLKPRFWRCSEGGGVYPAGTLEVNITCHRSHDFHCTRGGFYFRYVQSGLRSAPHARIKGARIDFHWIPNKNKDAIMLSGCWRSPAVTQTETVLISAQGPLCCGFCMLQTQKRKREKPPQLSLQFLPLVGAEIRGFAVTAFWPRSVGAASLPASLLRKHLPKRKDAAGGMRFPEYPKSQKSCCRTQQRRSSVDGLVGPAAETDEKPCSLWRITSDSSQRMKRWSGLNLPVDRRRKPGGIGASAGRCDRLQTALYRFLAADG